MLSHIILIIALNNSNENTITDVQNVHMTNPETGCGTRQHQRVFSTSNTNEKISKPGEFPWTVDMNPGRPNIYTGVLIHPKVVLTCAHKPEKNHRVRAGAWSTQDESSFYQDRLVSRVIKHPGAVYESNGDKNNIALAILNEPFVLGPRINTICLPEQGENMQNQLPCFASSFGQTKYEEHSSKMKKAEATVVSDDICRSVVRSTSLGNSFIMDDSIICAGNIEGVESCTGDGGRPLACPIVGQRDRYQLAGIEGRWGFHGSDTNYECSAKYYHVAFSNISKNRQWIDDEMKKAGFDDSYYSKKN